MRHHSALATKRRAGGDPPPRDDHLLGGIALFLLFLATLALTGWAILTVVTAVHEFLVDSALVPSPGQTVEEAPWLPGPG